MDSKPSDINKIISQENIDYHYKDAESNKDFITTVLQKTPEQLNTYLARFTTHEAAAATNSTIIARVTDPATDKATIRCTTAMNELLLRTPQNENQLLKIACLLQYGYNPTINAMHYVPYLSYNKPYEIYAISTLPLSNAIYTGNIQAVQMLLDSYYQPHPKAVDLAYNGTPFALLQKCLQECDLAQSADSESSTLPAHAFTYYTIDLIIRNYLKERPTLGQLQ